MNSHDKVAYRPNPSLVIKFDTIILLSILVVCSREKLSNRLQFCAVKQRNKRD